MAAAAVAAMRLHAPNAVVQQRRCGELAKYLNKYLTVGGAARKQEVVDAGGVAAVVAAMGLHTAEVKVQLNGCSALANLAYGDAVGKQATVDARGVAAVVAAMGLHTAEAKVQLNGCVALANLASPAPGSKQAVVDAGGVAAVLAAMRQHPADAEVQHSGCAALQNLTDGVTACKQAVVDAGGVAVLVAAMGQGGPLPTWGGPLPTAGLAARALANLAANTNPTVLEEVARTRTDCASWDGLREKLRECASAQLRAAEEGTAVAALEHAITLAAAVQVGAAALEHARGRVREINDDTKRQERRESLGLGSLVPPNEFSCPITMDKMRGVCSRRPRRPHHSRASHTVPCSFVPQTRWWRPTGTRTSAPPSSRCSTTATA